MIYPYDLEKDAKEAELLERLNRLTEHHLQNCEAYRAMVSKSGGQAKAPAIEQVPFIPVRLFKMMDLLSVPRGEVAKVLTSSGTSGQVSKIYLDKRTAAGQTKALVDVMKPVIGTRRLPMVIVDTRAVLKDRHSHSARGAGIIGFSNFGRSHFYALRDDMSVDWEGLRSFLAEHRESPILWFGFTYIIWKHLYMEARAQGVTLELGDSVLIHGGGWKKLQEEAVSAAQFRHSLREQFGFQRVHNYYGMVEQVGSIFVECSCGHLHAPNFADVVIRDMLTFEPLPPRKQGMIQVLSSLPESYPGHSLLTEDMGTVLGEDDCPCGWKGKYFEVAGRIPKAELRGCSDTYAYGGNGGAR